MNKTMPALLNKNTPSDNGSAFIRNPAATIRKGLQHIETQGLTAYKPILKPVPKPYPNFIHARTLPLKNPLNGKRFEGTQSTLTTFTTTTTTANSTGSYVMAIVPLIGLSSIHEHPSSFLQTFEDQFEKAKVYKSELDSIREQTQKVMEDMEWHRDLPVCNKSYCPDDVTLYIAAENRLIVNEWSWVNMMEGDDGEKEIYSGIADKDEASRMQEKIEEVEGLEYDLGYELLFMPPSNEKSVWEEEYYAKP